MILPPFCMVIKLLPSECFAFRWWFVAQRKAEVNGKKLLLICVTFLNQTKPFSVICQIFEVNRCIRLAFLFARNNFCAVR